MKAGKVWGTTELIEANGAMEFHRIEMKKNGVCSKHLHKYKWNGFYVESGTLMVKTWADEPRSEQPHLCDQTILRAGDYYKVAPGKWHQFVGVDDGVAFELYWAEFNADDIIRRTQGQRLDHAQTERHIGNPLTDLNAD